MSVYIAKTALNGGWHERQQKRFSAIRNALGKAFPNASGNFSRHLNTLAGFICGIVGSKSCQLPQVGDNFPASAKPASREKHLKRWLENADICADVYFLPFACSLLRNLAHLPLVLVMDGSTVGRGCVSLMVALVYKKRALPIVWMVSEGKKGHFPESLHIALIKEVQELVPDGARVVLLGDGEFDGINLQAIVNGWKWEYVCRTARSITLYYEGEPFHFGALGDATKQGESIGVTDVFFTHEKYGPVLAISWWRQDCKEPIYLISNMESDDDACDFYGKRFRIETFFSDQKSRGFNLHKSHISNPERLKRLMIAACLAYYWIIYLGDMALQNDWNKILHRTDRCDLSLFQLGLRLLKYLLNEGRSIPVAFLPLC
jgi:hypothetical protein